MRIHADFEHGQQLQLAGDRQRVQWHWQVLCQRPVLLDALALFDGLCLPGLFARRQAGLAGASALPAVAPWEVVAVGAVRAVGQVIVPAVGRAAFAPFVQADFAIRAHQFGARYWGKGLDQAAGSEVDGVAFEQPGNFLPADVFAVQRLDLFGAEVLQLGFEIGQTCISLRKVACEVRRQ
ncbi:hypothetical protein [Pseudomonas sp.]|uniref:hypothetical protein n=1 Tax=Pseudomonas sp. TaxID=306 RepID=UPI0028A2D0D0|nr:hypothetical protein [Pseudomonas sp.]